MADKTVNFKNTKALASNLSSLSSRIVRMGGSAVSVGTGSTITFSQLNALYTNARSRLFALSGSFGSRTLGNFQNQTISGAHGMGIVEKTVGDLEQQCTSYFSGNRATVNTSFFNAFGNNAFRTSFNAPNFASFGNNAFRTSFNAPNFASFGNSSFRTSVNLPNFSGNANNSGFNSSVHGGNFASHRVGNRSGGWQWNYTAFHTSQGGKKAAIHSPNHKTNWSGNNSGFRSSFFSTNFNTNGARNSGFNSGFNTSNFSGFGNSGNNSGFNTGNFSSNGFSGNNSGFNTSNFSSNGNSGNRSSYHASNFASFAKVCTVVHSTFRVEGVDF